MIDVRVLPRYMEGFLVCIRKGTKEECGDEAAEYQVTLFEAMLATTLEEAGCNIGKFDSRF